MAQYTSKDYKFDGDKLIWANPDLYLKSSGTQYIDTGLIPDTKNKAVIVATPIKVWTPGEAGAVQAPFFGTLDRTYGGTSMFAAVFQNSGTTGKIDFWPYIGSRRAFSLVDAYWDTNTRYRVTIDGKEEGEQILEDVTNGKVLFSIKDNFGYIASNLSLCIFRYGYGYSEEKVYDFKIYESDVLLHNFVPVPAGLQIGSFVVPSNGMFDIVEQKFYANQGKGDFEFGKDASRICIETAKSVYNIINKIILNQFVEITDFVTKKADRDLVILEYNVKKDMGIDVINRIQVCSADGTVLTDTTVYQPIGDSGETLIRHTFNVTEE